MQSNNKVDLSKYRITGPYTDNKQNPDISWGIMNDPKYKEHNLLQFEAGVPLSKWPQQHDKNEMKQQFSMINQLTYTEVHQKNKTVYGKKDRYNDILPYNFSKVVLQNDLGLSNQEQYINACYVNGGRKDSVNTYVCAQGPLQHTMWDFWKMVWQEETTLILMVTNLKEKKRDKCYAYFPMSKGDSLSGQDFEIICKDNKNSENLIQREFFVRNKVNSKSRVVKQLMYPVWPDHGAPDLKAMEVFDVMVEALSQYKGKTESGKVSRPVIHCSAGVGRTGTVLTCSIISKMLQEWKNQYGDLIKKDPAFQISVFGTVRRLREQRAVCVQSPSQYHFIHQFLSYKIKKLYS